MPPIKTPSPQLYTPVRPCRNLFLLFGLLMECVFPTPLAELFELEFALYGLPVFMSVVINVLTLITLHPH